MRQPLPTQEFCLWDQGRYAPPHRIRTKKQGFGQSPCIQQTVGKNITAIRISAELDLVDRQKISSDTRWHRLDRANPELCPWWHDTFFARHQRHNRRTAQRNNTVVNLARQQAQRQTNHTGTMRQHTLDRVMGFPRVGGAKNGRDIGLHEWALRLEFDAANFEAEGFGGVIYILDVRVDFLHHQIGFKCQIGVSKFFENQS